MYYLILIIPLISDTSLYIGNPLFIKLIDLAKSILHFGYLLIDVLVVSLSQPIIPCLSPFECRYPKLIDHVFKPICKMLLCLMELFI